MQHERLRNQYWTMITTNFKKGLPSDGILYSYDTAELNFDDDIQHYKSFNHLIRCALTSYFDPMPEDKEMLTKEILIDNKKKMMYQLQATIDIILEELLA